MVKKKRRKKSKCREAHMDWFQFIVDWNQLHASGASIRGACQFFGASHACLVVRRGQLAKLGIFLPILTGMRGFYNKSWQLAEKRVTKNKKKPKAPKMLADMASAGMVFRLMPVAAG